MRYLILVFLLLSCSISNNIDAKAEIMDWVFNNIQFINPKEEHGYYVYFQKINETLKTRKGTCTDFATLFMYKCYTELNEKSELVIYYTRKVDNIIMHHAVVKINNIIYDPGNNIIKEKIDNVRAVYSYETAMFLAETNFHF